MNRNRVFSSVPYGLLGILAAAAVVFAVAMLGWLAGSIGSSTGFFPLNFNPDICVSLNQCTNDLIIPAPTGVIGFLFWGGVSALFIKIVLGFLGLFWEGFVILGRLVRVSLWHCKRQQRKKSAPKGKSCEHH